MFRLCNERHISMLNIFAYALSKRRLKNMDRGRTPQNYGTMQVDFILNVHYVSSATRT